MRIEMTVQVDINQPGKPLPRSSVEAILGATRELLAERGVRRLTIEGVAARAGVAKTTIYRRWRGKHDLALAVLIDMAAGVVPTPDLGDTRAELESFVAAAVDVLANTLMGRVIQELVSDLAADPELSAAFHERVVAQRHEEVKLLLARGVKRGDISPTADPVLANELLFGPIYYRLLLSGAPLDNELPARIVNAVMRMLREDDLQLPLKQV